MSKQVIQTYEELIAHCEEQKKKAEGEATIALLVSVLTNDRNDIMNLGLITGQMLAYEDMIKYLKGEQ